MNKVLSFAIIFSSFIGFCQSPKATAATQVQQGLLQHQQMAQNSPFKNLEFKNVGPTVMSGRVVDVDVNPVDPTEMLVAYASGGLWYTDNNGTSFTPIMDSAGTINLGDIAVDWTDKTIWAGTGENNSSRSSYAGIGVLKSTDWGKTWSQPMLTDSHHIGRILINPSNGDHVIVAVTGPLYSTSDARGIYTTKNGGSSWEKTLYATDMAGFIDLAHSPNNFNIMYAASWEKDRKAWNFDGDGDASAIYKSTDAGQTWEKITTEKSGFPVGSGVGRIGLAVYDDNTVYAVHDSQFRRDKDDSGNNAFAKANSKNDLSKDDFKSMSKEAFLKLDNDKLNKFLKRNGFQEKYRADNVKNMVRSGDATPLDVAKYLENANTQLFDTPVKGAELYRSNDGGKTWKKTHEGQIDDVFYSYGYYFAQVRVDPSDVNHVYVMGVPIVKSDDGGANWKSISRENVHADHHALWINPNKRGHLINGNDGGLNISYDDGETWIKNNTPSVGQFYAINYDLQKPYRIYGGLQDNGVWVGAHNAPEDRSWHQRGQYPWETIMGGDGMQIQIDSRNSDIVYTGYQFGNYFRINRGTGDRKYIQPKHELGESPYRFNWQTPILLSSHNQDILYLGGNKLHRSMNQGDDWTAISPDLTQGGKEGNVAYGTLTTISESPFQFGLIYTGSDDGLVQVTKDGGANWQKLNGGWPANLWVTRVTASQHKKGRVYATLNGYRIDDFTPYIYMSEDYGKTWNNIGSSIPTSSVNVIIEHPEKENILFTGTDNATYISTDTGKTWNLLTGGMPPVAVHDLKIQPKENHLLVGTHGRSIYLADLDALEIIGNNFAFAKIDKTRASSRYGSKGFMWSEGPEPSIELAFYSPAAGKVKIEILNENGKTVQELTTIADKGLNFYEYDGSISKSGIKRFKDTPKTADNGKTYLPVGKYTVKLSGAMGSVEQVLEMVE
ncbi:WD40/YVTN/BNR-like repeat-containing protein [Nonlabens ulvanivorans]|uniref:BNR/Asp-box repeat protein n=1 Tax=Nonlabens ulvanivorans TaxID=906888 RepID=A0A084JTV4_NONUL|nr:sialidase family protein [Nonlabens ulvanivorans]KEZ92388.1 glycosyl hydrolase [Nonlabens ulvanivorans]PRX15222.1 BNR/Asp-box repeat protein [Nonlabens ulvanivorans]